MALRPSALVLVALCGLLAACSETPQAPSPATSEGESPEPTPFYVGRWAADPVWCTDQSEGFPITITPTRFEGRENICEMSNIAPTPEGGATADLTCQAEGETVREPILFSQAGADIAITWPDRGPDATLFSRCAQM
ncbi:MAG TPA: hypothetical protein VNS12_09670 [Pelagibacterium sp.]|uniref:hypothetical protein n=1 Tax=Pelagibacterium sp. TaxID=1967288 RepID=UPI002C543290|nr:hypothetical protein [Pelagibacterium sp.]HWJ88326.1 hypothetical protein [Pelagibacterium sp.]